MRRRLPGRLAIGLAITLVLAAFGLTALVWTPYPPTAIDIVARLQPPSPAHWLGTDQFGRDMLSMMMTGGANALAIGAAAVAVGLAGGVPLGLVGAAAGGGVDEVVGRAGDVLFAFPALLSAILGTVLFGPGALNVVVAIGIFNIAVFTRIARAAAATIWRRDFVRAAAALGRRPAMITLVHVLPNIAGTLAVQASASYAVAILAEATLGYLGLGLRPPAPSWGGMLRDAQTYAYLQPTLALFPGLAIAVAVLGLNLLGDGLRDLMDPRGRRR